MTPTTHTPGPWRMGNAWFHDITAGDVSIAMLSMNAHNRKHGEANARLIAAAPEMLKALQSVLDCGIAASVFPAPVLQQMRAAVAKATPQG